MLINTNERGLEYCSKNLKIYSYSILQKRVSFIPENLRSVFLTKLGFDEKGIYYTSYVMLNKRLEINNSKELFKEAEKAINLSKNFVLLRENDICETEFCILVGYAELARDIVSNVAKFTISKPEKHINCKKLNKIMKKVLTAKEYEFCNLYYGLVTGKPKRNVPIGIVDTHRKKRTYLSKIKKTLRANLNNFIEFDDVPETMKSKNNSEIEGMLKKSIYYFFPNSFRIGNILHSNGVKYGYDLIKLSYEELKNISESNEQSFFEKEIDEVISVRERIDCPMVN